MGAIKSTSAIYLTIADGKFCRRFQSPNADTIERVNKDGKVVYEEFYKAFEGRITNIQTRENEYGKSWMVTLDDNGETYIVQMNYSSGYSASFLKALPNVDFSKNVILAPSMKIEGEKKKTTMFINQDGKAIKWAYTRENPNGLPELVKIKVKGKETWDDSEQMEFLENMVKTVVLPQLSDETPF